ncbi:unnamed protein product [Danaus chrysippus]|uniref:(African queen) hypothetical protein n=1 Tax=Danaus chrysippus TaxID=151541 RepID=A0A8J2QS18_9NEOP|nr:unnamed protein product [Danaus chrysippus]
MNRFIARRGKPHNVFSDNLTTFVGAFNELASLLPQDLQLSSIDTDLSPLTPSHFLIGRSLIMLTCSQPTAPTSATYKGTNEMASEGLPTSAHVEASYDELLIPSALF